MKYLILVLGLVSCIGLRAQKVLTLEDCDKQFLENNLFLLANRYNVAAAKALTLQATLWENPTISAELNLINPQDKRFLDIGNKGQKALAVEQLIYLGHKKKNEIQLNKTNEELAELEFQDLLRHLKFELHSSFFAVYFNNQKLQTLNNQISQVDSLVNNYTVQANKGNIPLNELIRLQSLLLSLRTERAELVNNNLEEQAQLKLLLNTSEDTQPSVANELLSKYQNPVVYTLAELQNISINNRPDYQLKDKQIVANEWNLKWQKSLAVPDLTLGASYDQRGGAFGNQVNFTVGIPLPLWNKNQGNISYAQSLLSQSKVEKDNTSLGVQTEVALSLNKLNEAQKNLNNVPVSAYSNLELVYQGMIKNFQKRNVSLLEFTDFMESYNRNIMDINEMKKRIVLCAEELIMITNKNIF